MQWLWFSLIASVLLTVVANVVIRAWPRQADRGARRLEEWVTERHDEPGAPERRVRVIVPWKAMILASIVLTVALNLMLRIAT